MGKSDKEKNTKKYNYEIGYVAYNGKRYKVYAKTKTELSKKMHEKLMQLESLNQTDSEILGSINNEIIIDKWAELVFNTYKKGNTDLNATKSRYKRYVSPYIGHYPLSKVSAIHCQNILNECQDKDLSYSHCDKLKQELKFLFNKAVDNGLINKNPASGLTLPKVSKGNRRSITDEERDCLYKVYAENNKFLPFIIMLECGCRSGEVTKLLGTDINHKNKLLHIRGTKSENADRYVGIPDKLYEAIKDTNKDEYICINEHGLPYTKQGFYRLVQRLYREMNIEMGCTVYRNQLIPPFPLAQDFEPYCLRHTYCTDLAKAGVDIRTAQKLMGHANISITAEIYTHVDQDQILDANTKMNDYLNKKR